MMSDVMTCETLLTLLRAVIQPHESLTFTILPHAQGLALLVQPLPKKADNLPKEAEQSRAALSLPLRIVGSPAQLAMELTARLTGFADARREVHDSYRTLIEALNEAGKEAKAKTLNASKNAGPKKPAAPPAPSATSAPSAPSGSAKATEATAAPAPSASAAQPVNTGVMQPASLL
jgi:hypothetical protein